MRVKVLASGSKGNSTYIECGNTKILIDAGISYLQIKKALEEISVDITEIDILLLTHIHNDHIKGVSSLLKKTNIILYTTIDIYEQLSKNIEILNFNLVDNCFVYNNVKVTFIPVSHDVVCYSFVVSFMEKDLVYITDTGYLNRKIFPIIKNKDIYVIEANHDEKMLMDGPYPFILKQRILSDKGHLSNITTGKILSKVIGERTKYIFLAHISEHNNDKDLALVQVKDQLLQSDIEFDNIVLTDQYVALDIVEV